MDNIKCCVAKDLMPLYIDDVLSEGSTQELRNHLEVCESCQKEYQLLIKDLVLPSNRAVQKENSRILKNFKNKWTMKKILISVMSSMLAVLLLFPIRDAIMESELFQPSTTAAAGTVGQLYLGPLSDGEEWVRLEFKVKDLFSNAEYYFQNLEFNNIFYKKKIINNGNSSSTVEIRILDTEGNVVIEPFFIEPGTAVSLEQLEYWTTYIVEYRADGDFYVFNFI